MFDASDIIAIQTKDSLVEWMRYGQQMAQRAKQLEELASQLHADLNRAHVASALDKAQIEALVAQRDMLVSEIKACPHEHASIIPAADGHRPAARIYDETFDAAARARGIQDPESYRS